MEPHECKLDANDSTVGSELKEREREIPVIEEPRTEKRKKKKEKNLFSASLLLFDIQVTWADHEIFL